jgi:hypothetical protein
MGGFLLGDFIECDDYFTELRGVKRRLTESIKEKKITTIIKISVLHFAP